MAAIGSRSARARLGERQCQGDEPAGDRCRSRSAVGLEHVAVDGDRPRTELLEIDRRPERASDEPLNFLRPPARRLAATVAVLAARIGARVHLVFAGDPALPLALEKRRNLLVDRRRAQHDRAPRSIEHRAFRWAVKVGDHLDRAECIQRTAVGAGFSRHRRASTLARARQQGPFGRCDRECHPESSPAAAAALAGDGTAMRLDNVLGDRQAEPGALALGRKERVEDARANVLRDAAAAVVHVDEDAHPLGADADVDRAAARHRFARVAQKVQERLAQLRLVEERRRKGRFDRKSQRSTRALDFASREFDYLGHRGGDVVGLHARPRQSRDAQVLFAQVLEAQYLAVNRREQALDLRARAQRLLELLFEQLDVQAHRREGVSDLVGHVRGHLADRRKPLVREGQRLGPPKARHHLLECGFELADLVVAADDVAQGEIAARDRPVRAVTRARGASSLRTWSETMTPTASVSAASTASPQIDRSSRSRAADDSSSIDCPTCAARLRKPLVRVVFDGAERYDRSIDLVAIRARHGREEAVEERSVRVERHLGGVEFRGELRRQRTRRRASDGG